MAIKFSQFNERTDHTSGMYLVGYDGNQNIHITVDNLFDDFINGTENTIAMFGVGGTVLADSILSQDAGATILTVAGQLNVDAAATFDTNITVTGDSTLNGDVTLGNASTDLITQTGTLYLNGPVKDTTDTLGAVDQVLLSDAAGELTFTDFSDLHVGGAEVVEVSVKNVQGSALVKGDPVYISGSVGASGRLEVQLADASNTLKMPAVGLLKQDLANNAEGFAVVTGKLRNLITDPIDGVTPTENDVIYVKPSGTSGAALTTTKPVYGNFIQNVGKVGRVSSGNSGNFVVSSILRTNDIPNLTPGKIWVGSTGNTIESSSITITEATGTIQFNEYGSGTITSTAAYNLSVDSSGNIIETTATTYDLSGYGTNNGTAGVQLAGSDSTNDQVALTGAGTTSVTHSGNTITITSNDQYTGTVTSVSGGTYITAGGTATDPTLNHDATSRTDTTSTGSPGVGGNFTAVDSVTTNASGHVTALNLKTVTLPDDGIDGSGTLNYVAKFTPDGDTIGDSVIYDDGTNIGIETTSPSQKLSVNGNVTADRYYGTGNTTYYVDPNSTTDAANLAGNINISKTIPQIYLNSTNTYPGVEIFATHNGATSPFLGSISWVDNPGFIGSKWRQYQQSSPYSESSITLPASTSSDFTIKLAGTNRMTIDTSTGNVGINTTSPASKLDVNGGIRMANDSSAASASNVGTLKYYTSGNNSYVDMCMQTGTTTYAWVNIVQNNW